MTNFKQLPPLCLPPKSLSVDEQDPLYDICEQLIRICNGRLERMGILKSDLWTKKKKTGKLWLHFLKSLIWICK